MGISAKHFVASALSLHLGCSSTEAPPARQVVVFQAPDAHAPAKVRGPVRVALTGEPASWLKADEGATTPGYGLQLDIAGFSTTVFVTTWGTFVQTARGVLGPLPPTTTGPVHVAGPIGNDDAILAMTADGDVYLAKSADAAVAGAYQARGKIDPPGWLDAAGEVVAAAAAHGVTVSLDGGVTWKHLALPRDASVNKLFVRADGVVVVLAKTGEKLELLLSKGARPLARSSYQPNLVYRRGAVIRSFSGCHAALAADGVTWVAPGWKRSKPLAAPRVDERPLSEDETLAMMLRDFSSTDPFGGDAYAVPGLGPWERLALSPPLPRQTPLAPAAPPKPTRETTATGPARECPAEAGSMLLGLLSSKSERCASAGCIVNVVLPPPPRTNLDTRIFADGVCATTTKQAHGTTTTLCDDARPLVKAPTLARIDHAKRAMRALPVPQDCRFLDVARVGAGTWVFCEEKGSTRIYGLDARDRFVHETTVAGIVRDVSVTVARDGTLAIIGGDHLAHVRAPALPGTPAQWTSLGPRVYVLRALGGGEILAARVESLEAPDFTLGIATGSAFAPLAPPIAVTGAVTDVELLADGRVVVETSSQKQTNGTVVLEGEEEERLTKALVMNDGTLEPFVAAP